jgi:anti-sigma B factor antagonist
MTNFSTSQQTADHGALRLAINGEVDLATASLLTNAITTAITTGHTTELVIDLDHVIFLDAAGISSLVRGRNLAAELGIAYVVTNPRDMVRKVLDICGVLGSLTQRSQPQLP